MLILINTSIQDMVLDFIQEEVFHIQVEDLAKMLLFLDLIWAVLYMLIIKQEAF